jgi:hypothetical protein
MILSYLIIAGRMFIINVMSNGTEMIRYMGMAENHVLMDKTHGKLFVMQSPV